MLECEGNGALKSLSRRWCGLAERLKDRNYHSLEAARETMQPTQKGWLTGRIVHPSRQCGGFTTPYFPPSQTRYISRRVGRDINLSYR